MKFRMYQLQISKWIDSEEKICYKNPVYNITYEDNDTEAAVYGDYIIPTTLLTDKECVCVWAREIEIQREREREKKKLERELIVKEIIYIYVYIYVYDNLG